MENQFCLWKAVLEGNTKAFRRLVDDYFQTLFNYGLGFTKDQELVKDTIQEVFIVIWQSRAKLSKEVNIKAYLLSSLRRALHRKIKPLMRLVSLNENNEDGRCFNVNIQVDDQLLKKEYTLALANQTVAMLNSLPSRQKEVIYLKFFMSLTREEISDALGIAPQTVSNIIQMALKNLRTHGSPHIASI